MKQKEIRCSRCNEILENVREQSMHTCKKKLILTPEMIRRKEHRNKKIRDQRKKSYYKNKEKKKINNIPQLNNSPPREKFSYIEDSGRRCHIRFLLFLPSPSFFNNAKREGQMKNANNEKICRRL